MTLKFTANTAFEARSIQVDDSGVTFQQTVIGGGKKRFAYAEIDCVLMSKNHALSLQVGRDVFTIPTKPNSKRHQEVIRVLLSHVQDSARAQPLPGQA